MSVNCISQQEDVSFSYWGDHYHLYHLQNASGTRVDISDLGATIVHFWVTDSCGVCRDIVLGYDQPEDYLSGEFYIGAVVGPWANRIARGRYVFDGHVVELDKNEGSHHLHGGSCALHKRQWQLIRASSTTVALRTRVIKGEGGYPATIDLRVTYQLTEKNELKIDYLARPDQSCPVNLTQHSYFNLTGRKTSVLAHELMLDAGQFWQTDAESIPVDCRYVLNTPMDFRQSKLLGSALQPLHEMLRPTHGYDHCFMLNGKGLRPVATVREAESGFQLIVATTETAIQLYTGNYLSEAAKRPGFPPWSGFCLETECIPDQINMTDFSSSVIYSPAHPYHSTTVYQVVVS